MPAVRAADAAGFPLSPRPGHPPRGGATCLLPERVHGPGRGRQRAGDGARVVRAITVGAAFAPAAATASKHCSTDP
eukprot:160939-Lingulodinium_polyedra.AAC.1